MDFESEFTQVSQQMKMAFDRARRLSKHPGIRGDSAEDIVRSFLRDYLPKNLDISSGQIFDTNGNISRQLDIIVHDRDKTPILYLHLDQKSKLIPVECVYSVIEVKSLLNKNELTKEKSGIFKNMESVRALEKKAFYPNGQVYSPTINYGKEWEDWPINYFVFAFDSIKLETLKGYLDIHQAENKLPPEKRIDSICVLNKGIVLNRDSSGKFSACPDNNSSTVCIYTDKELLLFYALTSHFWLQAKMRHFRFLDYIRSTNFGVHET